MSLSHLALEYMHIYKYIYIYIHIYICLCICTLLQFAHLVVFVWICYFCWLNPHRNEKATFPQKCFFAFGMRFRVKTVMLPKVAPPGYTGLFPSVVSHVCMAFNSPLVSFPPLLGLSSFSWAFSALTPLTVTTVDRQFAPRCIHYVYIYIYIYWCLPCKK